MPRREKSVVRFETLIQANKDNWRKLLDEFEELYSDCNSAVVYGIPQPLLDSLSKVLPGLLTEDELGFERRLSAALQRQNSVGFGPSGIIVSCLFEKREAVTVLRENFDALGWEKCGLNYETINKTFAELESRGAIFHEQAIAFAGWLVTNPHFLADVAAQRNRRSKLGESASGEPRYEFDPELNTFCSKWQLAGMASWDLPEPQGPNLAGVDVPESARRGTKQVSLEIPLSMRLPARFPIRDIIAEISSQTAQPHLEEWLEIVDRQGTPGPGVSQFGTILQIHFFRNIVLAGRYGERFSGKFEALDRAFGRFLKLGDDSVKKLRLKIERRLGR